MMVGEHDWYFDMGDEVALAASARPTDSCDHKGVHLVERSER